MKYYYHLTTKECVKSILENGLHPCIGPRSEAVGENENYIYLTERKYLPYWSIIINQPIVLRVEKSYLSDDHLKKFDYSLYSEFTYDIPIPKEAISVANIKIILLSDKNMKEFCLSWIDTISHVCVYFARYTSYKEAGRYTEYKEVIDCTIANFKDIVTRLDFSKLKKWDVNRHLKWAAEECCATTLCDEYNFNGWDPDNQNPRLWQILGTDKNATESTIWLYKWIKKTFKNNLFVHTGGWTG